MSACEKCWVDSQNAQHYMDLINERNAAGRPCTPEEQAGPGAQPCPSCKRMTLHQYTGEPMCGCKERNA